MNKDLKSKQFKKESFIQNEGDFSPKISNARLAQMQFRMKLKPELYSDFDLVVEAMKQEFGQTTPQSVQMEFRDTVEFDLGVSNKPSQFQLKIPEWKRDFFVKEGKNDAVLEYQKSLDQRDKNLRIQKESNSDNGVKEFDNELQPKPLKYGSVKTSIQKINPIESIIQNKIQRQQTIKSPNPQSINQIFSSQCYPEIHQENLSSSGISRQGLSPQRIIEPKFIKLKNKVAQELKKDPKIYRMNAQQAQMFTEVGQAAMNFKFGFDDYMSFSEVPEINNGFQKLNEIIIQKYQVEDDNELLNQNTKSMIIRADPIGLSKLILPSQKIRKQASKLSYKSVVDRFIQLKLPQVQPEIQLGDFLKTMTTDFGQFQGVQFRKELSLALFEQSNHDHKKLHKAIKIGAFINRMVKDGLNDDFALIQIKDGDVMKKISDFADIGCQVQQDELAPKYDLESQNVICREQVFQMLKDHSINLIARSNEGKKGYLKMVWQDYDFKNLIDYKMERIFMNSKQQEKRQGLQFGIYIQKLLDMIDQKMEKLPDTEDFVIDNLFCDEIKEKKQRQRIEELTKGAQKQDKFVDAVIETRKQQTQTYDDMSQQTQALSSKNQNQDLTISQKNKKLSEKQGYYPRKMKDQLVLDVAFEDQVKETLKLFDQFVTGNMLKEQQHPQYLKTEISDQDQEGNPFTNRTKPSSMTVRTVGLQRKDGMQGSRHKHGKKEYRVDNSFSKDYDMRQLRQKLNSDFGKNEILPYKNIQGFQTTNVNKRVSKFYNQFDDEVHIETNDQLHESSPLFKHLYTDPDSNPTTRGKQDLRKLKSNQRQKLRMGSNSSFDHEAEKVQIHISFQDHGLDMMIKDNQSKLKNKLQKISVNEPSSHPQRISTQIKSVRQSYKNPSIQFPEQTFTEASKFKSLTVRQNKKVQAPVAKSVVFKDQKLERISQTRQGMPQLNTSFDLNLQLLQGDWPKHSRNSMQKKSKYKMNDDLSLFDIDNKHIDIQKQLKQERTFDARSPQVFSQDGGTRGQYITSGQNVVVPSPLQIFKTQISPNAQDQIKKLRSKKAKQVQHKPSTAANKIQPFKMLSEYHNKDL